MRLWKAMSLYLAGMIAALPGVLQAGTNTLTVTATVLSKSNCKIQNSAPTLSFGTINPAGSASATATATVTFKCAGSVPSATFLLSQDGGLHAIAPNVNRMQHATVPTQFLPYTISLSLPTGTVLKNVDQIVTITGTALVTDYQNVRAGTYTDTVVMTLSP
jgi:spore coat protein U-like protein